MATVISNLQSTVGSPYCIYTLTMTASNRTASTVDVSWTLSSHLKNSDSYMAYTLSATVYAGNGSQTKMIKEYGDWSGTTPRLISGIFTVSGLSKDTTSITTALQVDSGAPEGACKLNKTYGSNLTIPAWTSYTVSYDANGGDGAPSSQTKWKGETLTLSDTIPTLTGYTFLGWALSKSDADSGEWYYKAGGDCGKNENLTLYATWEENKLTVNYYSNYATSAFADALNTVGSDKNVIVWTSEIYYDNDYTTYGLANYSNSTGSVYMTRTGYTATGNWGTSTSGGTLINENTGYSTGQTLAQALGEDISNGNASIDLYAQWQINTYTITYNSNGGSGSMNSQTVEWQETFTLSDNAFKREGYKFVGWNAYRNADNTWYVIGQGWLTEDEILAGGYEKKVYANQDELIFDMSWIKDNEDARQFTMYVVWKASGVVYIDDGISLEPYLVYIDNGSNWDLYIAYVDNGTDWNLIS